MVSQSQNDSQAKLGLDDKLISAFFKSGMEKINLEDKIAALDEIFLNQNNEHIKGAYKTIRNDIIDNKGVNGIALNGYKMHEDMLIKSAIEVFKNDPAKYSRHNDRITDMTGGFREGEVVEQKTKFQAAKSSVLSFGKKSMKMMGLALLDNIFGDGRTTDMMVSSAIASAFTPGMSYDEIFRTKLGIQGKGNLMRGWGYEL